MLLQEMHHSDRKYIYLLKGSLRRKLLIVLELFHFRNLFIANFSFIKVNMMDLKINALSKHYVMFEFLLLK